MTKPFRSLNYRYKKPWLQGKLKRVSSTDIPIIMGSNPYESVDNLVKLKKGEIPWKNLDDNPYVAFGTDCEHLLPELFYRDIVSVEYDGIELDFIENPGDMCVQVSTQYEWASSTMDFTICNRKRPDAFLPVETKTGPVGKWTFPPEMYVDQCQWQMMVTGTPKALLAAILLPDNTVRDNWIDYTGWKIKDILVSYVKHNAYVKVFHIDRDQERIDLMIKKAEEFRAML